MTRVTFAKTRSFTVVCRCLSHLGVYVERSFVVDACTPDHARDVAAAKARRQQHRGSRRWASAHAVRVSD